jgi:hypothetical protein
MAAATGSATASIASPPSPCPIDGDALSFLSAYARSQRYSTGQPTGCTVAPSGDRVYFLRTHSKEEVAQNLYEVRRKRRERGTTRLHGARQPSKRPPPLLLQRLRSNPSRLLRSTQLRVSACRLTNHLTTNVPASAFALPFFAVPPLPCRSCVQLDVSSGSERLLVRAHDLVAAGDEAAMSDEERKLRERKRLVSKGILTFQLAHAQPNRILIPYQQHLVRHTTSGTAASSQQQQR